MGTSSWDSKDWKKYSADKGLDDETISTDDIYSSSSMPDSLNPFKLNYRESCDSDEHPESFPIAIGLDVTGSMSDLLSSIAKKLNVIIEQVLERKTVKDPQFMFMGIGDSDCGDRAPLQVTQFEPDIAIAKQLNDIWFEQGGGGNEGESYMLAWYFLARHSKIDSFIKRNKKGILFTIGDEACLSKVTPEEIKRVFGDTIQASLTSKQLLDEVSRMYEVFHISINQEHGYDREHAIPYWKNLLHQHAIMLERNEVDKIPETIVSIIEMIGGKSKEDIIKSWDGSTSVVISDALKDLPSSVVNKEENGLVNFDD